MDITLKIFASQYQGFILKEGMRSFTFDDRATAPISAVGTYSMAGEKKKSRPGFSTLSSLILTASFSSTSQSGLEHMRSIIEPL
jgi:hypothetical protein